LRKSKNVGGRIIGGKSAYAGQFPFAAAINVQTANSKFFCGGTLISNRWILTAGQCVDGAVLFTIHLGTNNLVEDDSYRVTVATSEYVINPNYNPLTLENDIGLIELRMPIDFSNYLRKIDFLASSNLVESSLLMAIGWGQTSDEIAELSDDLKWVGVSSITNRECQMTYGDQINENTVCIVGNFNEGSCYGDTGSPLLQDIGKGYIMHVGIASFVSGNGCESTDPSGYVRTYPYTQWIRNVTNL
ncbi:brachyurin-like, partial [Asbolus verrucosus]